MVLVVGLCRPPVCGLFILMWEEGLDFAAET